ncbi:hypothetical protein FN846DRAFT_892412 [Sphaerosporella brunnea]|uniref:Uncharacterized protein n=1 Tax=Sphaerosporella brunnea TaxID=1250544 RepID=A0A5J5EPR5_9PEZI|nr:hypothetical protein FN846DRAFT_892412 [Sphaerosporella brunnea]
MAAEDLGLFANLRQSLMPEVTRAEITNAYFASDAVVQELGFRQDKLEWLGLKLVYSILPDRQPPEYTCAGSIESQFDKESKYLEEFALSCPHDAKVATSRRLTVTIAEFVTRLQSAIDIVDEELTAIIRLFAHLELWLLPRFIPRSPATQSALEIAKKWRYRQGLPDCIELNGLVYQQERLAEEIRGHLGLPQMQNCEEEGIESQGEDSGGRDSVWSAIDVGFVYSDLMKVTRRRTVEEPSPWCFWALKFAWVENAPHGTR